jgi:hypothetical protein
MLGCGMTDFIVGKGRRGRKFASQISSLFSYNIQNHVIPTVGRNLVIEPVVDSYGIRKKTSANATDR